MKRTSITTFLSCCILTISYVQANQVASNHNSTEKFCGGYARAGYIQTDVDGNPSQSAFALGGEYACKMSFNNNINISLGGSTSI